MTDSEPPTFNRILLKLSGEALMGDYDYGIDPTYIRSLAKEVKSVSDIGVEVAMVIGGGNIFRGAGLAEAGMDRVTFGEGPYCALRIRHRKPVFYHRFSRQFTRR